MAHSGHLLSFLALALLLASATPTRGNPAQPRDSQSPINFSYDPDLENDNLEQPIPLKSYPKECSVECGRRGSSRAATHDEKIVGGKDAKNDEFPWRCLIETTNADGGVGMCGCTVLSQNWIMTAAHCTYNKTKVKVFAGFLDERRKESGDYQSGPAAQVINHRSYNPPSLDNDIALIRVARPITFGSSIKPACLPYGMSGNLGKGTVTASGWGATSFGNTTNLPPILQKLDNLPLISRQQCQQLYKGRYTITENMICTYGDGIDACQGDSGGSIDYLGGNGRYKSIGVVSFGDGCAKKDSPGVYADVTKYLGWISKQTGRTFCR